MKGSNTNRGSEPFVKEIVDRIVEGFHPHKVILFGSFACGQTHDDSDLDLFIIMDSEIDRPDLRAMKIRRLFRDLDVPMDLIVYTPEEVSRSLRKRNPFIRGIISEGRVLYERQHEL